MTTNLPQDESNSQVSPLGSVIDFNELARVIIEDHRPRSARVAPDLRDWNILRLNLLCAEFGIDWSDTAPAFSDPNKRASALLSVMPSVYTDLQSPMAGFLEFSPVPGEMEILDEHIHSINQETDALKQQWRALFRDLLALRWPDAVGKTTTINRLRELGLGQRPDPDDFF